MLDTEVVDLYFPASGLQFAAAAPLAGAMTAVSSAIMSACMTRYGFHLKSESAAEAASQFADNSAFPDLAKISRTGTFDTGTLTAAQLPPPDMPPAKQRAYQAVDQRCRVTVAMPFAPLNQAASGLVPLWQASVEKAQSSALVMTTLEGYRYCMEAAGVPAVQVTASSSAGSFGLFLAWETGQETYASGRPGEIAVERHWAPIFVRCAKPTVVVQERKQLAEQKAFLQEHQQQVQALEALASQELAAAGSPAGSPAGRPGSQ